MRRGMTIRERLLSKACVNESTGCWEWTGKKNADGYGRFGLNRRIWLAHRLSYAMHLAAIPEGMVVRHRCDNPACINPDHLLLGTHADNVADMISRGRANFSTLSQYRHGETNPNAKLSAADAAEIRRRYVPRVCTQKQLAREYGVCVGNIQSIVLGKSWATLERVS